MKCISSAVSSGIPRFEVLVVVVLFLMSFFEKLLLVEIRVVFLFLNGPNLENAELRTTVFSATIGMSVPSDSYCGL